MYASCEGWSPWIVHDTFSQRPRSRKSRRTDLQIYYILLYIYIYIIIIYYYILLYIIICYHILCIIYIYIYTYHNNLLYIIIFHVNQARQRRNTATAALRSTGLLLAWKNAPRSNNTVARRGMHRRDKQVFHIFALNFPNLRKIEAQMTMAAGTTRLSRHGKLCSRLGGYQEPPSEDSCS